LNKVKKNYTLWVYKFINFLNSWVIYMEEKDIPLVGPKHTPLSCWRLGPRKEKQSLIAQSLVGDGAAFCKGDT
jgi:hypothetical protein